MTVGLPIGNSAGPPSTIRHGALRVVRRSAETAALLSAIDAAAAGHGRTILLLGEPGIGKTVLLRAALRDARRVGPVIAATECLELERTQPFAPFTQLLGALEAASPEARDAAEGVRSSLSVMPKMADGVGRSQLFMKWDRLVEVVAAGDPLLIVIDDLHWADQASLDLVAYLARKIARRPVALLCTVRSEEPTATPHLASTLTELTRHTQYVEIRLSRFTREQTASLVRDVLQLDGAPDHELVERVHARAEGNPLLIGEIVRGLIDRGMIHWRSGAWFRSAEFGDDLVPSSILGTVQARLARMDRHAVEILRAAAVLGPLFDFDALATVARASRDELLAALHAGIEAQLIEEERVDQRYGYRFRHVLLRDAVEHTLLGPERALLHSRAAAALEGRASHAELAHHYEAAGDPAPAARHHATAAFDAFAASTNDAMLAHSERTLALAPAGSLSPGQFIPLMASWYQHAEPARALRFADALLQMCVRDDDRLARGRLLTFRGLMLDALGRPDESTASCEQAVAELDPLGDSGALARALANLASKTADIATAVALARRSVEVAGRVDLRELGRSDGSLAHSEGVYAALLLRSGSFAEGLALHARTTRMIRDHLDVDGAPLLALLNSLEIGSNCVRGAPGARARLVETRDEVIARAKAIGARSRFVAWAEYRAALDRGDWDECVVLGSELGLEREPSSMAGQLRTLLMQVFRVGPADLSGLDAYERSLDAGPAGDGGGGGSAVHRHGILKLFGATSWATAIALASGDPGRALRLASPIARVVDTIVPTFDAPPLAIGTIVHAITAARLSGDQRATTMWTRSAELVAQRAPLVRDVLELFVAAERHARRREHNAAARTLALCADRVGDFEQPFVERLVRLRRVEVLAAAGEMLSSQTELDALVAYWRTARAQWYLGQLETALAPLGLVVRAERADAAARTKGPVTAREREVARLVAEGLTNKQIAERLGISARTVETHVEQVRAKLGFSSRAQIAAWVAQRSGLR